MSGTEREFDALLSEGIASSEKEFFDEAMGQESPETEAEGDRSLESMGEGLEGRGETDDGEGEGEETEGAEADPKAKAKGEEDGADANRDEQGRFKPQGEQQPGKSETRAERGLRNELTGEREKRKTVESEFTNYRTEMDRRFAALEARLSTPAPQQKAQAQEEQQKDEAPDRWTDPDGYDRWREQQILKQVSTQYQQNEQRRVSWSFEDAKAKHGDVFIEAYKAADAIPPNDPVAKQIVDRILQSANPGEQLMSWYRQQQAVREIGNDPAAFREKAKAEAREELLKDPDIRKQILAEMRGEATGDDSPRSTTRLPPSLSSARAGALSRAATGGTSDGELFADVMGGR